MNVRLQKNWAWSSGLWWDDQYHITDYAVTVYLSTVLEDNQAHNIAYERMKYWIHHVLHGSLLIELDHEKLPVFQATGQRVLALPAEPVDQIIGIMLFSKFTAMVENRLLIQEVKISSDIGDRMVYCHNLNEEIAGFSQPGWWNDPGPRWTDTVRAKGHKVINLQRMPEWQDLDLGWETKDRTQSTVVFADFPKNENK